jgi:cell fate regulator YaaT (PSP1 superfamily)
MKLVNVETALDRSKIVFFFVADNRVDFRELVKDLVQKLRIRIELRQISARRETQIMGGLGVCGRELCCVNSGLSHDRVSIKMAKEQGVAINPEKISGLCGRLMCCLAYEFETYTAIKSSMPPLGSMVQINDEPGRVVGQNIITNEVVVEMKDGRTLSTALANIGKSTREGHRQ